MKNYFINAIVLCSVLSFGQNSADAIRYSQSDLSGTARFTSMSGAFGALGGDLSAISQNPAGSTFFNNNQAGLSLRSFNTNNKSNYFGNQNSQIESTIDINQAGGVFIFESDQKSNWSKIAFALNYETTSNFDNSVFASGIGRSSASSYFLSYANGIPLTYLQNYSFDQLTFAEQQAFLGYQAYIINPLDETNPNNVGYYSGVPGGVNYNQTNELITTGFNSKFTINGAAKYKELFSFGLNLNVHFVDYNQSTIFFESNNYNNTSNDFTVRRFRVNNDLYTYGTGFSAQLGTIITPIKQLRIGLSYQSPTWFRLNDELRQSAAAVSGNVTGELPADIADPQITLIYEPYRVRTAGNFTGSLAFLFGKRGLISFDYIYQNNDGIKLGPNNDFAAENSNMKSLFRNASQFRLGGEIKVQKFSFRGGYRFEQSPYEDGRTIGDLTGITGGIGYTFGRIKLDASYAYAQRFYDQNFFSQGFTDFAVVNMKNHSVTTSLIFEF